MVYVRELGNDPKKNGYRGLVNISVATVDAASPRWSACPRRFSRSPRLSLHGVNATPDSTGFVHKLATIWCPDSAMRQPSEAYWVRVLSQPPRQT